MKLRYLFSPSFILCLIVCTFSGNFSYAAFTDGFQESGIQAIAEEELGEKEAQTDGNCKLSDDKKKANSQTSL